MTRSAIFKIVNSDSHRDGLEIAGFLVKSPVEIYSSKGSELDL